MIAILAPNVANQIAAGEVIERPSSVVKELIENSIDAGAGSIEVEILNAGRELIRVRDDGEGIEEADLPLVFRRSATSKITSLDDIYRLMSLGFRGEALASIASVARCDLSSTRRGASLGKKISIAGGVLSPAEDINFKQGTEIRVRDLFYNTPVRYKFLKSDAVEKGRLIKIVSMLALSHPSIALRLNIDGAEIFALRGNSNLKERVQALYGREFARALIPVHASSNDIEVSGYIAGPEYSLGNRSQQFFIINGRVAEADVLKKALNEAYDGLLMKHRHQAYVVTLTLPPQMVDVNVHPQKLEVKFDREDIIYSLLYNAARNALITDREEAGAGSALGFNYELSSAEHYLVDCVSEAHEASQQRAEFESREAAGLPYAHAFAQTEARPQPEPVPRGAGLSYSSERAEDCKAAATQVEATQEDSYEKRYLKQLIERMQLKREEEETESPISAKTGDGLVSEARRIWEEGPLLHTEEEEWGSRLGDLLQNEDAPLPGQEEARPYLKVDFSGMRIVGQALRTFIVLEDRTHLYFVDQHAAHERVLFERFYKEFKEGSIVSQMLISPYEIPVPRGEEGSYAEALDYFRSIGIEAEAEGDKVLIKALPVFGEPISIEDMRQLWESFLEYGKNAYNKNFVDMIIMRSCKAAIKSGDELNEIQMRDLLNMLSACQNPKTCPHGRPVVIELDRRFFDRLFKRIV